MKRELAVLGGVLIMATAALTAAPATAAPAATTLTMSVSGCEGCTITPSQYRTGMKTPWSGAGVKVIDGVATLVVPTANTNGMTFAIDATWKVEINAQPLIVFQYKGAPVGGVVTKADATSYKRASACWSGTSAPTADIAVTVRRVWMPAFPPKHGRRTQVPLAWVTPTPKAPGGFEQAYKGVLATQDVGVCP